MLRAQPCNPPRDLKTVGGCSAAFLWRDLYGSGPLVRHCKWKLRFRRSVYLVIYACSGEGHRERAAEKEKEMFKTNSEPIDGLPDQRTRDDETATEATFRSIVEQIASGD